MNEDLDSPPPPLADKKYTAVDYVFQLITVTAGVLIALLINGLVELNANRRLVNEARATLRQEVLANQQDLQSTLAGIADDVKRFDNALAFAADLLAARPTTVSELKLHMNLADLSASGWRTAERTGALAHMRYDEVQRYSLLYDLQDLYSAQQRTMLSLLADASAILSPGFDPDKPDLKDLEVFRDRVMRLRAALTIHEQMGKRLAERYQEIIQ
jgi:hypothetical protein